MRAHVVDPLKGSEKALVVGGVPYDYLEEWDITSDLDLVEKKMGVRFEEVSREELAARYKGLTDQENAEAAELASELLRGASQPQDTEPPGYHEVREAAQFYVAVREIMRERRADAATVVCRAFKNAGFPVPCVALTLLQDTGTPAACQGDIDALLTMVLFRRVSGHPGFMGGAREDNGRLAISHCVLSRRMAGPKAPLSPYSLADYHGTRNSPTIRTEVRRGQTVTVARFTRNLENLLLASGTVVECVDMPGGCRNTLIVEIANLPCLMDAVRGVQYHLVAACGDYTSELSEMAERAGVRVIPTED